VINGDIWCDWDVAQAPNAAWRRRSCASGAGAESAAPSAGRLLLRGSEVGADATADGGARSRTFSGIGVYRPQVFAEIRRGEPASWRRCCARRWRSGASPANCMADAGWMSARRSGLPNSTPNCAPTNARHRSRGSRPRRLHAGTYNRKMESSPPPAGDSFAAYRQRRLSLIERMSRGGGGVALIPTAPEQPRNRDTHFPTAPTAISST
jgi:hypothetical protein